MTVIVTETDDDSDHVCVSLPWIFFPHWNVSHVLDLMYHVLLDCVNKELETLRVSGVLSTSQ